MKMRNFYKKLKNNSEIIIIILIILSVLMFMLNMLFINVINDKTAFINGLKSDKTICYQKYDSLLKDYEKLEKELEK